MPQKLPHPGRPGRAMLCWAGTVSQDPRVDAVGPVVPVIALVVCLRPQHQVLRVDTAPIVTPMPDHLIHRRRCLCEHAVNKAIGRNLPPPKPHPTWRLSIRYKAPIGGSVGLSQQRLNSRQRRFPVVGENVRKPSILPGDVNGCLPRHSTSCRHLFHEASSAARALWAGPISPK